MKTLKLLAMLSVLLGSVAALAAEPVDTLLVAIYSAPGYVHGSDQYQKNCLISMNGALQYTHERYQKPVIVRNSQVSPHTLAEIKQLIEDARIDNGKLPPRRRDQDYPTYSGDAPDYGVEMFATKDGSGEQHPLYLLGRGQGFDLTAHSKAAKVLEKKLGKLCGMSVEFRQIRRAIAQMGSL